ncbi:hypothetical protein LZ198_13035 [Myxococcus sp. K15C18031901]|uniref:hypothetical protein n=1 Tax=Myxococcus dinghuensis TaxID=2906761 RepID=UPI0020A76DFB|nr:hypothetical protein [Myxococcus dinghuensis]MCP3099792.1 hypothetical protein [Myxococcus dinghuensis]
MPGSGSEALRGMLFALGAVLVLSLALHAGDAESSPRPVATRDCHRDDGVRASWKKTASKKASGKGGALFHVTDLGGWDSALQVLGSPAPSARSRAAPVLDLYALSRWTREREHSVATTTLRERRCAAAPSASGDIADRPSIVTRPLRGPPLAS